MDPQEVYDDLFSRLLSKTTTSSFAESADPVELQARCGRVIRQWFDTGVRIEWLVLEVLPVIHSAL